MNLIGDSLPSDPHHLAVQTTLEESKNSKFSWRWATSLIRNDSPMLCRPNLSSSDSLQVNSKIGIIEITTNLVNLAEVYRKRERVRRVDILRIFSDIVEAASVEFESFSGRFTADPEFSRVAGLSQEDSLVINHNWATVKSFHKKESKKLLFQISAMRTEIETLRDGLFNAQSVREAQKSRELNKIMMVFTIVTILFLPPTFVATFFGVDIFHAASDVQTRKIFWTVFSIVTVTTFVTSIGAILGLLTPASWTRLRSTMPKLSGSSDNLPGEQEGLEKTQSTWRRLSSFLRRRHKGARTPEQDSTLA
ncbi:hypothetical protein K456DRAFT_31620 [Colletotrichum gloeosporioides 23]|nr:hypothetical protein K456DRAFT_31620 [Colletotrichum gloeosporioides 23]